MKLPRFTVRNLMFITTIFAVGLFVAQGFWEGMPPRSVVHCISYVHIINIAWKRGQKGTDKRGHN
jgi:hypothetical protein